MLYLATASCKGTCPYSAARDAVTSASRHHSHPCHRPIAHCYVIGVNRGQAILSTDATPGPPPFVILRLSRRQFDSERRRYGGSIHSPVYTPHHSTVRIFKSVHAAWRWKASLKARGEVLTQKTNIYVPARGGRRVTKTRGGGQINCLESGTGEKESNRGRDVTKSDDSGMF